MQCRLIFWLFSVAIIHKASGKPQSSTRLRSSVRALRYSLLHGERCPTLSCFFGKPQPRWGSRKLNITPDFIAGSRGWPIVSYLEKGHRKKITEQKSQKQPPNQPPSCPCFDIRGGISRNGQAGAAACRDWDTMEQGLPPCHCHLQEPPGAHSPRPDGLIGASRANPMPPRWDLSCLSTFLCKYRIRPVSAVYISSCLPRHQPGTKCAQPRSSSSAQVAATWRSPSSAPATP